jgi:outer membrane protein insertion porin family
MRRWIVLVLVVFSSSACSVSAQTSESNKVSFEGQRVATVELVANPKISVESLRPLVRQQTGEPYSDAQVQETVSALKGMGRFSKVEVDVKPDPGGLHVTFTLEPALYFGIFDFPGATKNFSYTKLLQVMDIPNRTPYQEEAVSKARDNLQQFFVSAGYFEAQVQPQAQFDERHLLANVVFHIDLGKRAKLGDVEIQGTEPGETDRLLRATRSLRATATGASLKPGKPYTPKRIKSGLALMKRSLANQHHLASKVQLEHPQYHADTHRADLVIDVRPGPIVRVRVTGAKLSPLPFLRERQMKKLIPIFSEGTVDPDLVEEGRRNLIDFFQSKGYFDAKVTTNFQNQSSNVELVYNVERGSRHKVETVDFRGNQHFGKDELIRQVVVKPHRFLLSRGKFSNKLLRQSVLGITAFYKNLGYEEVKVDPDVVDREPEVYITFQITDGPQTVVANLTVEGNSSIASSALSPKGGLRLRPGQPFSPKALADDRTYIMAAYLDRGFLSAEFDSAVTRCRAIAQSRRHLQDYRETAGARRRRGSAGQQTDAGVADQMC